MLAFEDAVRVHGYADDVNAIMAFQTLNEKTTVLSPEVLLSAGVPCCRLVQNPGDFVITFPGAYHSGFSHGFNCGEASNIATPRWLQVAKEAAIRRASTNCGPMVSHYQLLYELALSLRPREPKNLLDVPRSSRLRDKKKNEGEIIIKETFVESVIKNNNFLSILLGKGPCIVIPEIEFPLPSMVPEVTVKQSLGAGVGNISQPKTEAMLDDAIYGINGMENMNAASATISSVCNRRKLYETKFGMVNSTAFCLSTPVIQSGVSGKSRSHQGVGLLDQGRLPCVQCGILSFACVAIVQPKEAAIQFVLSRECSSSDTTHGEVMKSDDISNLIADPPQGHASRNHDNIINSITSAQVSDRCGEIYSSTPGGTSALGLLASAYDSSDSDEEPENISTGTENNDAAEGFTNIQSSGTSVPQKSNVRLCDEEYEEITTPSLIKPPENESMIMAHASRQTDISHLAKLGEPPTSYEQWSAYLDLDDNLTASCVNASSDTTLSRGKGTTVPDALAMLKLKYNKDSCKMHVFCLEHALETWTQLQQIGGANIMILCHPEYPRAESTAKVIAEDIGMKHAWKDITFKVATDEEIGVIKLALQDEDTEPTSSDWAVKMGINIYYSAKQSKSPLYSKQVPYNSIIYKAFGQENPDSCTDDEGQRSGTTKKKVAGWWCGKVWMSNQVHPLLALEQEEQNHDIFCSKAIVSSTSHDKIKESSARSTRINRSISKRLSRPKQGDSAEKSRAKKKRCTASDEPPLHHSGIHLISEASNDQLRNFDDYSKHDNANEGEEKLDIQKHQQHELQNMNKKSSCRRRKGEKRNNFYELHDENGDIECKLDIDSIINTSIGDWDSSPPPEFAVVKVESGVKLQSSKGKSSKCKTSDLPNGNKKLQKMDKKASTKKEKNCKANRHFRENHTEDVDLAQVRQESGDEATQDNWDEIQKQKSNDVKVKSRGKIQNGKEKISKCQPSDDACDTGCNKGNEAMTENGDETPKEKSGDTKVKSRGKIQSGKKKGSKHQISDGLRNGDKGAKYTCDIEGCDMSFSTQQDLTLHKRDICPVKGCKKKFFCHKYLLQHRKVHLDERPLMCDHPGCKKTFKWPWARTEHMRVHTGVRPYACTEPGCTQTFRFVSDFSRHKRKTGHCSEKKRKNST